MGATLTERLTSTPEGMRLYQQERAIQEVTDLVCELMEELDVNRTELARRLGRTKGYITQLLDGRANMSIRTISDVFTALDRSAHFHEGPLSVIACPAPAISLTEETDWLTIDEAPWPERKSQREAPPVHQGKLLAG